MKRRLTFHLVGGTELESTMDHDDAEQVLSGWQQALTGAANALPSCQVDGIPVFHIALAHVAAITDEIA